MLASFGFRSRADAGEGDFFCPRCGADRHYLLRRGRRRAGGVTCLTCQTTFGSGVLQIPTSANLAGAITDAMRLAAAAVLRAGGRCDPAARRAAVDAVAGAGAAGYDDGNLTHDLRGVGGSDLAAHFGELARGLNEHGKEMFVTKLARIAAADAPLDAAEQRVLEAVGAALGMSRAHLLGVVLATTSVPERATGIEPAS